MKYDFNTLSIYTICFNPLDYPGKYTARRHVIVPKGDPVIDPDFLIVKDTLEEARQTFITLGLIMLERDPKDDPVIVETWI